jgi:hypothetical protein
MRRTALSMSAVLLLLAVLAAPRPATAGGLPAALAPIAFLLGDWEGGGVTGRTTGGTSFATNLQGRVIIRTNFAIVTATDKSPGSRHDDLMVIYADEAGQARADYYDNEGRVIRYVVASHGTGHVIFTSEPTANAPRYRTTYEAAPDGSVRGALLIAPAGKPDAFAPNLAWTLKRQGRR